MITTTDRAISRINDIIDIYNICCGKDDTVSVSVTIPIDCFDIESMKTAIKALESNTLIPVVTSKSKTAYWISWYEIIEEEWGTEHNPHCKCSECSTEVDPHTSKFINCCPVCGAKMIGYKKREEA